MKICSKCKKEKNVDYFSKNRATKDGFQSNCKECCNKSSSEYYLANIEKKKEYSRKYYLENIEKKREYALANADKLKEYSRLYNLSNADKRKKYRLENINNAKAWRLANVDKTREYNKEYRRSNPEKDKNYSHTKRARKLANGTFKITTKELKKLYSSPCFYCGSTESIQADHVLPISRGGRHSIGNLVPACKKCNLSKRAKLLIEWRKEKSLL
jgi:5-methylcytosine-specific restriction endonuclease McrA